MIKALLVLKDHNEFCKTTLISGTATIQLHFTALLQYGNQKHSNRFEFIFSV